MNKLLFLDLSLETPAESSQPSGVSRCQSPDLVASSCNLIGSQSHCELQQQRGSKGPNDNLSVIHVIWRLQQLVHLTGKFDLRQRTAVSSRHLREPGRHRQQGLPGLPALGGSFPGHMMDEHICQSKGVTASTESLQ